MLKAKQLAKNNIHQHTFTTAPNYEIITIGASTGGPGAVELIVNNLPSNLQIPVVIAQHMPHRFLESFAVRLNTQSPLPVRVPAKGEMVQGGNIYIAPGEGNLRLEQNIINGLHNSLQSSDSNFTPFQPTFDSLHSLNTSLYILPVFKVKYCSLFSL